MQVLDDLPAGIQMRIMRAAPSLEHLLHTLPLHMHATALSAKIRSIDVSGALQIPHAWSNSPAWQPGVAAATSLTHLTRLSAAVHVKGHPARAARSNTDHLFHTVSRLGRLETLVLCGLDLDGRQAQQLTACMLRLPRLASLRLSGSAPGGSLHSVLAPCTGLVTLSLAHFAFAPDDMHASSLAAALASAPALSALDLSHTGLTHGMWADLQPSLLALPCLRTLNLSSNRLGREQDHPEELGRCAGQPQPPGPPANTTARTLQAIDLCRNICDASAQRDSCCFMRIICGETALTRLDLAQTHAFHACSGGVLQTALCACSELRWLGLADCKLDATEVAHLARGFSALQLLSHLDLRHNRFRDAGAAALAAGIASLQHLRVLLLDANEITDNGAEVLAPAASGLPRLRKLHMMANCFGNGGVRALCCVLPQMTSLRQLLLSGPDVRVADQEALALVGGKLGVQVIVTG